MLALLVGIAAVVTGVVVLTTASSGSTNAAPRTAPGPDDHPVAYTSQLGHHSPVASASVTPEQMLEAIVKRYGGSEIVSAKVGARPFVEGLRPGIWLDLTVNVPANDERADRARWAADLVVGAVADASAETGRGRVAGVTLVGRLPDGTLLPDLGGGIGDVANGQSFTDASEATIKRDVSSGLAAFNLKPISIAILRSDQPAPAVVAETTDPRAAAAAAAKLTGLLFGADPPKYEGYYLEVRDSTGEPVFIESTAFRSGVARLWVSPAVADAISVSHK